MAAAAVEPYRRPMVTIADYVAFRAGGHLIVRGVLDPTEVQELLDHAEAHHGHLQRIHMLHREIEVYERYLLHPGLVDIVAALIGPDVLALQTMLFIKPPGSGGQGYHQDSYHIVTEPDSLIGAWVALDGADTDNGCLWITEGSQHEPIYPDADETRGHGGTPGLADTFSVSGADHPDEARNGLTAVAAKYPGLERPVVLEPGDAVLFGGRALHRSHANRSTRNRRAFVAHYCNARSWVPWEGGNGAHILARGETHLPHAQPRFARSLA
jgi:ectoine hydroxylase-related dioxygenase (phytanoyl-CoA dioxygenase family)